MWFDIPPVYDVAPIYTQMASSMPIKQPEYSGLSADGQGAMESAIWMQAEAAFATSPGSFPGAQGIVWYVNGHPIVVVRHPVQQDRSHYPATVQAAVPEQLDLIKSQLGISVTQLAELFSVTRKTVYDWYEGQSPRNAKSDRIQALVDALDQRHDIDLKRLKGFWNISLPSGSFRSTLQSDTLAGPELINAPSSIDSHGVGRPCLIEGMYVLKWFERRVMTLRTGIWISLSSGSRERTRPSATDRFPKRFRNEGNSYPSGRPDNENSKGGDVDACLTDTDTVVSKQQYRFSGSRSQPLCSGRFLHLSLLRALVGSVSGTTVSKLGLLCRKM